MVDMIGKITTRTLVSHGIRSDYPKEDILDWLNEATIQAEWFANRLKEISIEVKQRDDIGRTTHLS